MHESTKTKKYWGKLELDIINQGKGIDIGAGSALINHNAKSFDKTDGDANCIDKYIDEKFDYVFSSHCLEHMFCPEKALKSWWSIVKPGGYLILIVPDEDLYEQGYFPSLFNDDHKFTFTLSKQLSWSDKSINLLEMVKKIEDAKIIKIELQDNNYDRSKMIHGFYKTNTAFALRKVFKRFFQLIRLCSLGIINIKYHHYARIVKLPIDQTNALRQIQVILKKQD